MKIALILGITGQTGSYLAELLLSRGYQVHGLIRKSSNFNTQRIDHIFNEITLHYGDLLDDTSSLLGVIQSIKPNEIYNLAAQSHVKVSFECPILTTEIDAVGPIKILEIIKCLPHLNIKFFQASTSEMYGGNQQDYSKQEWENIVKYGMNEETTFHPKSPYGNAKLYAYNAVKMYRESYGIFAITAVAFNHESPRRDPRFVTRKVTRGVAHIKAGLEESITLGNLDAQRDWGHAQDYAEAYYLMMQNETPTDYVIATGVTTSIKRLVDYTFSLADIELEWKEDLAINVKTGKTVVKLDSRYFRPNEVNYLRGDASKIKRELGWEPKTNFEELIKQMYNHDSYLICFEK